MWHFEEDFYDGAGDYDRIINYDWPKLDTLLCKAHIDPSGTKVSRLNMCRSILSSSKIAHQI